MRSLNSICASIMPLSQHERSSVAISDERIKCMCLCESSFCNFLTSIFIRYSVFDLPGVDLNAYHHQSYEMALRSVTFLFK